MSSRHVARYARMREDGRLECYLCPRNCLLQDGQKGACFVREREGNEMILSTYGRSSGFCIDPIEKKPLHHFYPGSSVLSFGTAGCNLACKFCQNWDISKASGTDRLTSFASPEDIALAAREHGCKSVAFTYNDPVIFAEYAIDTARACHELGVKTVAVTAGYINDEARRDFYREMDAANVDLKAFSEDFYHRLTGAHLAPVLDTLRYLARETSVWLEITTLLIPGKNDSPAEITAMSRWIAEELGTEVPLHFTAFHPDYRMTDIPATPAATLKAAREIAKREGLKYVYTGNVADRDGGRTCCPSCGSVLIERERHRVESMRIGAECPTCGEKIAGRFGDTMDAWDGRRIPVRIR